MFGIKYELIDKVVSIKKCRMWRHPTYSDSYQVGPVNVQLIIVDELPDFTEIEKIRISSFTYIINEKIKIIEDINESLNSMKDSIDIRSKHRTILHKHEDDLTQVVIKFNCAKNE